MRGGKKDLMTFHSKKLAEYMSIDLDGGKAFEISTVIGIYDKNEDTLLGGMRTTQATTLILFQRGQFGPASKLQV